MVVMPQQRLVDIHRVAEAVWLLEQEPRREERQRDWKSLSVELYWGLSRQAEQTIPELPLLLLLLLYLQ